MKKYPKISIIFPTFNGWEDTKKCLSSIAKLNYPKTKIEVIVVDNASTDDSVEMVKKFIIHNSKSLPSRQAGKIQLIENKKNLGFAKAVNQGVKKTKSEIILVTNNDVVFEKKCLKELVKTLKDNSQVGAVGGKVIWQNKNRLCIDGFRLNPYLGYHQFDLSGLNRKRECDWISGNCFFVKKKLFLDFGGFDEAYFFYFEDVDLSLRLRKTGLKLLYNPKAILHHGYSKTIVKEKLEKILYLGYRSRWRCVFKNANLLQILTSSFFLLTFFPFYQSLKTRRFAFKPMFKGLAAYFNKGR